MSVTQDDLAALEKAIASGALTVTTKEGTVQYRSLRDMMQARDMILRKLNPSRRSSRVLLPDFDRGY